PASTAAAAAPATTPRACCLCPRRALRSRAPSPSPSPSPSLTAPRGRATLVGMTRVVPRYCSRPLPRTGFVPGVSRRADRPPEPLPRSAVIDFDALARDDDFRYGIDLFNHAL